MLVSGAVDLLLYTMLTFKPFIFCCCSNHSPSAAAAAAAAGATAAVHPDILALDEPSLELTVDFLHFWANNGEFTQCVIAHMENADVSTHLLAGQYGTSSSSSSKQQGASSCCTANSRIVCGTARGCSELISRPHPASTMQQHAKDLRLQVRDQLWRL
jgi:hypothetical protein